MELLRDVPDDAIVGLGRDAALTCGELRARAAAVARALPAATPGSQVAFAFGRDRGAFAAALLGAWSAGHAAALPADSRRESVTPVLGKDEVVAFVHDTGVGRGIDVLELWASAEQDERIPTPVRGPAESPWLVVHDPVEHAAPRALGAADLAREVDAWARSLDWDPGATIASTQSPTFAPALFVDLLLPLRHGGRFALDVPRDAEEAAADVRALEARTLVGSAVRLREMARDARVLAPRVLCATREPLDAQGVRHEWLIPPREGPGAEVQRRAWAYAGVRDAAVATLAERPDEAFAIVVPDEGAALDPAVLEREFGGPGLTARVRLVEAFPRDPNGRADDRDVLRCFDRTPDGARLESELRWCELPAGEADVHRFEARVPATYRYYDGHFDSYAVLAGAVQLHELVLPCLRRVVPGAGVQKVDGVKFLARIAPGDTVVLALKLDREQRRASFTIARGEKRLSIGRVHWAEPVDG